MQHSVFSANAPAADRRCGFMTPVAARQTKVNNNGGIVVPIKHAAKPMPIAQTAVSPAGPAR
jgi:hypothetical protein